MIDADKLKAFLAEYRDLVDRHGLGLRGNEVVPVDEPDVHCARLKASFDGKSSGDGKPAPQAP